MKVLDKLYRDGWKETLRAGKVNLFWWLENEILFHAPKLLWVRFAGFGAGNFSGIASQFKPVCFRKPRFLYLELTNNCNLACKMCLRGGGRKLGYMPYEIFTQLIDEAAAIGGMSLSFHFAGEATLHPKFKKCLQYALKRKSRFYKMSLTTNGTLFTEDLAKAALGLDWVTFSMDGIGEVDEKIRVGTKYDVVKRNLETFLKLRGNNPHPIISINTVISTQTYEELSAVVEEWKPKGVNVSYSGCLDDSFRILPNPRYAGFINPKWMGTHRKPRCYMPFANFIVTWNGNVHLCCHNLKGKHPLDCVFVNGIYVGGIKRIWRNFVYQKIREHTVSGRFEKGEICYECRKRS